MSGPPPALGPDPSQGLLAESPAVLYAGRVMHARLRPRAHRFAYRAFFLLIDLDRTVEASRLCRLFTVGRFNLLGWHPSDHGAPDAAALKREVLEALAGPGGLPGARVRLLCFPRVLGYVFNPISVHLVEAEGRLAGVVYEVRNTFGERHLYPVLGADECLSPRHAVPKRFHVSPFLPMELTYRFTLTPPGEEAFLRILESDGAGPLLVAAFKARRRALTSGAVLRLCLSVPLMTLKVVGAIHWEALRLWVKGLRIHTHPARRRAPALRPDPLTEP